MQNALDKHGDFATSLQGTMVFDDFLIFKGIITRYSWKAFMPEREKLLKKKLEIFRAKNQAEYIQIVKAGQLTLEKTVSTYSQKACEWIDLTKENFLLTHQEHLKDDDKRKKIMELETKIRHELETQPVTESKEEIIKIWKFKIQKELDMQRKMATLTHTLAPQGQREMADIEMNKIADAIMEEFGMSMTHLLDAVRHHNVTEDPSITSLNKIIQTQLDDDRRKAIAAASLPEELK